MAARKQNLDPEYYLNEAREAVERRRRESEGESEFDFDEYFKTLTEKKSTDEV